MRIPLAAVVSLALAFPALASEHYQPVRVELVLVGAYGPGDIATYGGGMAVEPKFNATDHLALGLRIEAVGMASESIYTSSSTSTSLSGRGVVALLAKADYYLTTSSVRPFVGFGAGYYWMGSATSSATAVGIAETSGFGVAPQVGVNFGHFRIAAAYNVITGGEQTISASGSAPKLAKNYFSFELGGTIGGGRTDDS